MEAVGIFFWLLSPLLLLAGLCYGIKLAVEYALLARRKAQHDRFVKEWSEKFDAS